MKNFFGALIALMLTVSSAQAGSWPERLVDLPAADLVQVRNLSRGVVLEGFSLIDFRSTVGEHAIVTYFSAGPVVTCTDGWRAGEEDQDYSYIDLYVEGTRIKNVVNFTNYACPQD